jgi:hypothetical protein
MTTMTRGKYSFRKFKAPVTIDESAARRRLKPIGLRTGHPVLVEFGVGLYSGPGFPPLLCQSVMSEGRSLIVAYAGVGRAFANVVAGSTRCATVADRQAAGSLQKDRRLDRTETGGCCGSTEVGIVAPGRSWHGIFCEKVAESQTTNKLGKTTKDNEDRLKPPNKQERVLIGGLHSPEIDQE